MVLKHHNGATQKNLRVLQGGVAKAVPPSFFIDERSHAPQPPAARRGPLRSPSACAPLRARLGPAPPCARKRCPRPCPPLRLCMLRGSGQPAPPACRSRLRSAGCAVCPSQRSHTPAALSVPRSAAHTQPPLWAWPAERLTCAGRVGSSRRRALRYGGWAATFFFTFAGGCGAWDPLASLTEGAADASR